MCLDAFTKKLDEMRGEPATPLGNQITVLSVPLRSVQCRGSWAFGLTFIGHFFISSIITFKVQVFHFSSTIMFKFQRLVQFSKNSQFFLQQRVRHDGKCTALLKSGQRSHLTCGPLHQEPGVTMVTVHSFSPFHTTTAFRPGLAGANDVTTRGCRVKPPNDTSGRTGESVEHEFTWLLKQRNEI